MTFANVGNGSSIFLDANTLVYHFIAHGQFGAACTRLLEQSPHRLAVDQRKRPMLQIVNRRVRLNAQTIVKGRGEVLR